MNNINTEHASSNDAHEVDRAVVFADLTGSTRMYESLGNTRGTALVTMLTGWLSELCQEHQGEVIKVMGDGVLMTFVHAQTALEAAVALQRAHASNLACYPAELQMRIKVGIAFGPVVQRSNECFGDAVNVASGLCDLAGPDQVFVDEATVDAVFEPQRFRLRPLGAVTIPGRTSACLAQRLEWQDDVVTAFLTMEAPLTELVFADSQTPDLRLHLRFLDSEILVRKDELPIFLGRDASCSLVVADPRVSRVHATIEWKNGVFSLRDKSSYGTWVRFRETDSVVSLRRDGCPLHGKGEIALGSSFSGEDAATISFSFLNDQG